MQNFAKKTTAPVSLFRSAGMGRVESVTGTARLYKAKAAETGGRLSCFEMLVPPGAIVPPRRHPDEDRAFYCLDGEIVMEMEGMAEDMRLGAGDFCLSPRGRWHAFRNETDVPARALCFVTHRVPDARMTGEIDTMTRKSAPALEQLAEIVRRHGASPVTEAV
jgi:quercetin dioxygenase-like cupin family protein